MLNGAGTSGQTIRLGRCGILRRAYADALELLEFAGMELHPVARIGTRIAGNRFERDARRDAVSATGTKYFPAPAQRMSTPVAASAAFHTICRPLRIA